MPPCTLTHTLRVESSTADQRIAGRASVLDVGESTSQTKLAISAASLILNDCRYGKFCYVAMSMHQFTQLRIIQELPEICEFLRFPGSRCSIWES